LIETSGMQETIRDPNRFGAVSRRAAAWDASTFTFRYFESNFEYMD